VRPFIPLGTCIVNSSGTFFEDPHVSWHIVLWKWGVVMMRLRVKVTIVHVLWDNARTPLQSCYIHHHLDAYSVADQYLVDDYNHMK